MSFTVTTVTPKFVTSITVTGVDGATTITTNDGTLQMSATILPTDADDSTVTWTTIAGTGNATVNATGLITALANGTVTVRATANDGSGIYGELQITITGQTTPTPITYTITFNANGGIVTPSTNQTKTDGKLESLPIPTTSENYSFSGWFTTTNGGTQITTNYIFTTNSTIYAQWTYIGGNNGDESYITPIKPPQNPSTDPTVDEWITTDLGNGNTVDTPPGQDPVDNGDGSTTLPGGGTITTSDGNEIEAPPGTNVADDGTITFPPDSGGTITIPDADALIPSDEGNPQGCGSTINVPPGTVIDENNTVHFPEGSGGGTITDSYGNSFNVPEDAVIVLDLDTPLGYYISIENPFEDVKENNWFYDAVMFAYSHGLMIGTSSNPMMFSPNVSTTRGMIVTILYRMAGSPDVSSLDNPFEDVEDDMWYTNAIKWAAANGLIYGNGKGLYDPNAPVTRQDLTVILYRYADYKGIILPVTQNYTGFTDNADIADYAKEAVESFFMAGIIGGYPDGSVKPQSEATRAEFAAILMRFLEALS